MEGAGVTSMSKVFIVAAAAALLSACGRTTPVLERYYDPRGYFSADFPAENVLQVIPPQEGAGAQEVVSGVASIPNQQSPQAGAGAFGGLPQPGAFSEQQGSVFVVYVLQARGLASVEDLAELHTDAPGADVKLEEPIRVGGRPGVLVVADHEAQGASYSQASAFVLEGDAGYWIAALFPQGAWEEEREGFLRLLRTFRTEVPPAITALTPEDQAG